MTKSNKCPSFQHSTQLNLIFILFVLHTDTKNTFPILVILLYPALYIFMTASIDMTVVLAVNRCLEIMMLRGNRISCLSSFLNSGMAQSLAVFLWATIFILPRWFEYKIVDIINIKNVTHEDKIAIVNETVTGIKFTWLRKNYNYNLYYYGIVNPLCCMVIPLAIMVVSSILMLRQMRATTASLSTMLSLPTSVHQWNQEKRNRRISIMLLGIIMLLVICHLGDMIIKCYHAYQIGILTIYNETTDYNEQWMINFTIINNTLAVTNSSLNFAIYCKDSLFRQCARKVCNKFLKCPTDRNTSNSETVGLATRNRGVKKKTAMGETSLSSEVKPLQS